MTGSVALPPLAQYGKYSITMRPRIRITERAGHQQPDGGLNPILGAGSQGRIGREVLRPSCDHRTCRRPSAVCRDMRGERRSFVWAHCASPFESARTIGDPPKVSRLLGEDQCVNRFTGVDALAMFPAEDFGASGIRREPAPRPGQKLFVQPELADTSRAGAARSERHTRPVQDKFSREAIRNG